MHQGVDKGEVRERLREVAEMTAAHRIELLGVQAERAGQGEQLLAEGASMVATGIPSGIWGDRSDFVERPELARIDPGIRDVLGELTLAYALVAVVSGRPRAHVAELVGVDRVQIAGLYGLGDEGELSPSRPTWSER